ncbi:MAG TPA: ABC transporter ATP-binding protein [Patescibacteria group bacterium]|nr:ABC transporter ATP-binding protein [Patescibacteria group bacterium]
MIKAQHIVKTFINGDVVTPVLKGIDLDIRSGEFVAIIGPSGAGKSTLMYQLSLLDHPTKGSIVIDGRETAEMNIAERTAFRLHELGYVFQDYAILPELTAVENVMTPILMKGTPKKEARKISLQVLDQVGLSDRVDFLPNRLSGGQQQRVSIARAIAHEPKILFADEPTANLDTVTSREILSLFMDLHVKGQTIVMVTHEKEFAEMAERIIELKDGRIISDKKTT